MRKLLIGDSSDTGGKNLAAALHGEYDVHLCQDASAILEQLAILRPDVWILNLSLTGTDGFSLLQQAQEILPPVVITLTVNCADAIVYRAAALGVSQVLVHPYSLRSLRQSLEELLWLAEHPDKRLPSPQDITLRHMQILGLAPGTDGFQQIRIGVPMLAQDPGLALGKELYPMICQRMDNGTPQTVEFNIRKCITRAWNVREKELWRSYFPNCDKKAPANGEFLSRLALLVEQELRMKSPVRPIR